MHLSEETVGIPSTAKFSRNCGGAVAFAVSVLIDKAAPLIIAHYKPYYVNCLEETGLSNFYYFW